MTETWRPVVGYEGHYEVSDLGRVRSLKWGGGGHIRAAFPNADGYLVLELSMEGRRRTVYIHTLVVEAFHGPRPPAAEIRHLDGTRDNNVLGNLEYGTKSLNVRDAVRHGTHHLTARTHCPQGHPYDEENTRRRLSRDGSTHRTCRACVRETSRRRRAAEVKA